MVSLLLCIPVGHKAVAKLSSFPLISLNSSYICSYFLFGKHLYMYLRNKFNFWSVHGIMNPSGLVQSK